MSILICKENDDSYEVEELNSYSGSESEKVAQFLDSLSTIKISCGEKILIDTNHRFLFIEVYYIVNFLTKKYEDSIQIFIKTNGQLSEIIKPEATKTNKNKLNYSEWQGCSGDCRSCR